MMAGRRITKLMQTAVCFFGVAILLSAPSAQAITYDVSLDWTLYGNLNQQTIPDIGDYSCGPTSVVNSFVYLQNSYPEIYGHALVPDLNGTPDIYENGELVTVAEILASSSHMNTTYPDGTWTDWLIYGKQKYIEDNAPGSTIYAAQNPFPWLRPPVPEPSWVEKVLPTWSFLYDALVGSADLEICINGDYDHFLTLTSFYWDDTNDDGIIDTAEDAWIDYVDPWTGDWGTAGIWHSGPSILTDYAAGSSFISRAVTESPVPEPSSILLAGLGLLGLAAYGRRRRRSATALRFPRLHVIVSAMVMAGFGLASGPVLAAGFDYALDELRVTGNLEFFDDFEDGSRTAPPTSAVVDWLGTVSIEEGGFLILNSDNGSFPRPDLGQDLDWIEGLVDLSTPIVDGGSGTTTITASFRPDVPEPFSLLWDGGMYEHYGVYLGTEGFNGVEISVHEWVPGVFGVSFFDNRIYNDPTTGGMLGQETVPTSSITGNIVLELVVDHASDTVTPRYSLDGGASFVDGSDWWAPAQAGPVFDTGNEAFVSPFVFGYVPEPGTGLLVLAGMVALALRGRLSA